MEGRTKLEIFLFIPNLIGYLRLLLIAIAWVNIDDSAYFLPFYLLSIILDGVDGWAARKFNQISDYGACLDVLVDLIGRGMVWTYISKYGYAVIAFEWIVFVGNNERAHGSQWKNSFETAPSFAKLVMKDGFKTKLGFVSIMGLHVLPPWLYALRFDVFVSFPIFVINSITIILILGRIFCAIVELWCAWNYLQMLLSKSPYSESR